MPVRLDPLGPVGRRIRQRKIENAVLIGETCDPAVGKVAMTRPVYPYPLVAQYDGEGDPSDAASYRPCRIS